MPALFVFGTYPACLNNMESIMSTSRSALNKIRLLGLVFGCIFLVLLLARFGVFDYFRSRPKSIDTTALANVSRKEAVCPS